MPNRFAAGKKAFGFCQRCGFRYDLRKLKAQTIKQKTTALRVCPECLDEDHPQLMLGTFPIDDPQALRNPRPDPALADSRVIIDNGQSISDLFLPPTSTDALITTESDQELLTENGYFLIT